MFIVARVAQKKTTPIFFIKDGLAVELPKETIEGGRSDLAAFISF